MVLNDQLSSWSNLEPGAPQGSIHGPLLFLIHINGFSEGLTTKVRLFADDVVSLFFCSEQHKFVINLNDDLRKINVWANLCKMAFNPNLRKHTQKVIFSRKIKAALHPPLNLNNKQVNNYCFKHTCTIIWTVNSTFVNLFKTFLKR